MITEEQLKDRLKMLEEQKAKMIANVNAIEGAIQDVEYFLTISTDKEETL